MNELQKPPIHALTTFDHDGAYRGISCSCGEFTASTGVFLQDAYLWQQHTTGDPKVPTREKLAELAKLPSPSLDVEKMVMEIAHKIVQVTFPGRRESHPPIEKEFASIVISSLQPLIDRQAEAVKVISQLTRLDQPYTTLALIENMQKAVQILFEKYDYRDDFWEQISLCAEEADTLKPAIKEASAFLTQPSNPKT